LQGSKGKLSADLLKDTIRGQQEWEPKTKVIALENSTNKGGGSCYTEQELAAINFFANENDLNVHLDGARIWNAMTATQTEPTFFSRIADTMSVCFSKGLGAPVGSMILSSQQHIIKARRMRKMWGGGMRQIGILAAAADYAVEHHLHKLKEDHRRARELAKVIDRCSKLSIDLDSVETNILIFDVKDMTAGKAVQQLAEEGVKVVPFGPNTLRATFHFQIDDDSLTTVKKTFKKLFEG
jgi:threonine aldolase